MTKKDLRKICYFELEKNKPYLWPEPIQYIKTYYMKVHFPLRSHFDIHYMSIVDVALTDDL